MNTHDTGGPAQSSRGALLGALLAGVALVGYVWFVGTGDVLAALGRVPPDRALALAAIGFCPVLVWGLSLRIVFAAIGVADSVWEAVALFVASVFLNGVTPFGQVGGDPPSALLIARRADATFETGLAAIASVNALNRVAVVLLGVVGGAWYTVRIATVDPLREAVLLAVGLGPVGVIVAVTAWRRRHALADWTGGALGRVLVPAGDLCPGVTPPSRGAVRDRARGFVASIDRVASHPVLLAAAFLLGVAGQLLVAAVLWFVLAVLGVSASLPLVLLVVPAAKLAGFTPLPGGTGGAEALLAGLLVAGAGTTAPVATAAALLHRVVAFWLPTVVGGLVTIGLLVRSGGRSRR